MPVAGEQQRDIAALIPRPGQRTTAGRCCSRCLIVSFQQAQVAAVTNERGGACDRQMIQQDEVLEEQRRIQQAGEELEAKQAAAEMRKRAQDSKLEGWRKLIARLKSATGVSSIDEMFSILASKQQYNVRSNLESVIKSHEANISKLTAEREKLRNEKMRLKYQSTAELTGAESPDMAAGKKKRLNRSQPPAKGRAARQSQSARRHWRS